MRIAETTNILESLKAGVIEASDLAWLERLPSEEIVAELCDQYPITFLESRTAGKWELGRAQTRRGKLYQQCLLLTSERGRVTTLALMTYLRVRRAKNCPDALEFISGGGLSLYRDPDGWKLKLLQERTVRLSKTMLDKRGWMVF